MFRICNKRGQFINRTIKNDCKDVKNHIYCETKNEKEAEEAYEWCSNACFGQSFKRDSYTIECFNETKVKDGYQSIADALTARTDVQNMYVGVRDNELIWKFMFMEGVMYFNMASAILGFRMYVDRDSSEEFKLTTKSDVKNFLNKITTEINKLKPKYKFEDKKLLQSIADEITNKTGVTHNFAGYDNGSLTWDFDFGVSYMTNREGKELYFAVNDSEGRELFDILTRNKQEFISSVVKKLKEVCGNKSKINKKTVNKTTNKPANKVVKQNEKFSLKNDIIVNNMRKAEQNDQEYHCRIYNDGCWWIDIERHPYGQIRFWVGFEDKRNGATNGSICSINHMGIPVADFIMKEPIKKKVISVVEALKKANLYNN